MPQLQTYPTRRLVKVAGVDASGNVGLSAAGSGQGIYNIIDYGADPTGVNDSAPAVRACLGSDRIIIFPPGNYRFKTSVGDLDNRGSLGWYMQGFSNFMIIADAATIIMDTSTDNANGYGVGQFQNCHHFTVRGFRIQHGNTAGFNAGFGIGGCSHFRFNDISHDSLMVNQAFYMGYCAHGLIDDIYLESGQGLDATLLLDVKFRRWFAYRAAGDGGLVFGIAQDPYTSGEGIIGASPYIYPFTLLPNQSGYDIPQSNAVTFSDCHLSGFSVGMWLREGQNYTIINNNFENMNPTVTGPVGVYLTYQSPEVRFPDGGIYTSEGRPVQNVIVTGNMFTNFGDTVPGTAVFIDASTITNSDKIANVIVDNNIFDDGNFSAIGFQTGSETHVEKLLVGPTNIIRGAGFTFPINTSFIDVSRTAVVMPILGEFDKQITNIVTPSATEATIDTSGQAGIAIANGANAVFTPGGQGMLVSVLNTSSLASVLAFVGGGFIEVLNNSTPTNWEFNTLTPTGGKQSLAYDGVSAYRIYNNTGGSVTYKVMSFKPE